MKRITQKQALDQAYYNLYHSDINKIDKHLDELLKAKKFISKNNSNKQKTKKS